MEFEEYTLERIAELICGDNKAIAPVYRSSWYLTQFFKSVGLSKFEHDGSTRRIWVMNCLRQCSSEELEKVILGLASPKTYKGNTEELRLALKGLNEVLNPEGVNVELNGVKPVLEAIEPRLYSPVDSTNSSVYAANKQTETEKVTNRKYQHDFNDTQLHVLRMIRTSPSRVSVRKISEVLLYPMVDVKSALQVLMEKRLVRQDYRDKVNWDHEQATYFTIPSERGQVDNILQLSNSEFPRPLRAFLCHSHDDKREVHNLYRRLRADNIDPWLDEEKLLPGQEWNQEIRKAVREADVVIVCLSRGSISKAGYVQKEIKYALDIAEEQPDGEIFLIPLKLEQCEVPERLKNRQWVDYFEESGYSKLLKS
jgi:hypothetical protein